MSFNLQLGFTSGGPDHEHQRAVDNHGDGNTSIDNNHLHIVVGGKVMEADGHSHDDIDFPFKGQNGPTF